MTIIRLPDPSLVVLVGAAGSGKSTFARRYFAPDEILSSDAFRARISGDEANQVVSAAAFTLLHRLARERLEAGGLTVVDATSVRARARRPLLRIARGADVPAVAIGLDLPAETVLARNAGRLHRVVDVDVVREQLDRVRHTLVPGRLEAEGFSLVVRIMSAEALEEVRIERLPTGHLRAGRLPRA